MKKSTPLFKRRTKGEVLTWSWSERLETASPAFTLWVGGGSVYFQNGRRLLGDDAEVMVPGDSAHCGRYRVSLGRSTLRLVGRGEKKVFLCLGKSGFCRQV